MKTRFKSSNGRPAPATRSRRITAADRAARPISEMGGNTFSSRCRCSPVRSHAPSRDGSIALINILNTPALMQHRQLYRDYGT